MTMANREIKRQKILIADDSEINRAALLEILEDSYDVKEAEDGTQTVEELRAHAAEFSLVLLNITLPEVDGFEVLAYMNRYHWIDDIPVVMISAENAPTYIERAYDFGVTDYISRPFDPAIVRRRIANTLLLSARQRRLAGIATDRIYEREKSNTLMISILSHIVEFRNGESGTHVLRIKAITDMLLRQLVEKTDRYVLTPEDIARISKASILHDIGKISIPSEILNKPGRLTASEFEIIKRHSIMGAEMLAALPEEEQRDPMVKTAYEICHWHHERYDGGGYPDGLKGDDIPISAQVVSLADVYDALTSDRCYKAACSHEEALRMILGGQCGMFNPLLLECLLDVESTLQKKLNVNSSRPGYNSTDIRMLADQLKNYETFSSDHLLQQLEFERQRFQFLLSSTQDIIFSYSVSPPLFTMNDYGGTCFGLSEPLADPLENQAFLSRFGGDSLRRLEENMKKATASHPDFEEDIQLLRGNELRYYRCICRTIWPTEGAETCAGLVGKLVDIDEGCREADEAKSMALRCAEKQHYSGVLRDGRFAMTGGEAWVLLQYLRSAFDTVRLVDASVQKVVVVDNKGRLHETEHRCFAMWNRHERCENCISAKCLYSRGRLAKFMFIGDEVYHVLAMYVEIDGQPYSLEMVNRITDETLLGAYGREELVDFIVNHNQRLYADPVTGVYNRRYYDEQISALRQVYAVAMLDVDRFKEVNDTYGHQTGDMALKLISEAIRRCVRKSDAVIRYGGDEFVVVFRDMTDVIFHQKLEEFRRAVGKLSMEDCPDLTFSVSVGGAYGPGRAAALLRQADEAMYQEKNKKRIDRSSSDRQ